MLKAVLFQLHWLLGITAGTVLAVMGVTGATLAFQDELLRALNPSLAQVVRVHEQDAQALPLAELVARVSQGESRALQRIRVDATGTRPSVARFEGGRQAWRYFDPYTGQRLDALHGLQFFDFVEELHRRLAAGQVGRAITGACAITLVFFCLSGLYMRWPRRWTSPRAWLVVEWGRSGRSFLWSLHSVLGTWVLPVYLMIALTGLWWSYDWYRSGLTQLLGGVAERSAPAPSKGAVDLVRLQAGLEAAVPGVRSGYLDLRLPGEPGQAVSARVQVGEGPHDRAYDSLQLDAATGAVLDHQTYAAMPTGRKVLASMFALHSGSFFGLAGRLVVMVSALGMSLFFVTGWMLYLDRRRKQRQARASRCELAPVAAAEAEVVDEPWLIAFASQSGLAEQLAWQAAAQLRATGQSVQVQSLARVDGRRLAQARQALFFLSTFGDGQAPDAARPFERKVMRQAQALPGLRYAVLALGDRQYAQFCGFAQRVDAWLRGQGGQALFPMVEVDRDDPVALQAWQRQLAAVTGVQADAAPIQGPALQAWQLEQRLLLNPGSAAGQVWQIVLRPPPGVVWQAGDLLEIAPRLGAAQIQATLDVAGLDPQTCVGEPGQHMTLAHALESRAVASVDAPVTDAQPWLEALPDLPLRTYSLASLSSDGVAELVVRLVSQANGQPGWGSGWLCVHALIGAEVQARVRHNPNFHQGHGAAPMILIGNGTGIAGLRSLLRQAQAAGQHGHWLLYGERTRAHDHLFADEQAQWQASGLLARTDLAFSRDQPERIYVQQRLLEAATTLQAWVAGGASVYVCGALLGMAEGVDQALRAILGDAQVDELLACGRYRRDVY